MGKASETRRQLRWNVRSDERETPQAQTYFFLVINEPRGIDRIIQKLEEQLAPVDDVALVTEGNTWQRGVGYRLVTMRSATAPHMTRFGTIYKGKIVRDENLYPRQTRDGLARYVDDKVADRTF